jgi:hypothetical protein
MGRGGYCTLDAQSLSSKGAYGETGDGLPYIFDNLSHP